MSLTGKVALITGGSKGIGKATAQLFVKQGGRVAINYGSDKDAADATVKELNSSGGGSGDSHDDVNAIAIQADAGSLEGIEKIVKETVERFGRIDVLIPNAATDLDRDLESTIEAEFDKVMKLNVKGPYFLVQKAAPHMPSGSHIILLSTSLITVSQVMPHYLLYVTSKGAIEQMSRIMAKDLGRKGIFVNTLAPGPTATEMFFDGKSEQMLDMIRGFNPFNKLGTPESIAEAALFLATSSWTSGQVLRVNGAMS